MSRKSRPVKKITVDPAFAPPIGADDYFKLSNQSLVYASEADASDTEDPELQEIYDESEDGLVSGLVPPSTFVKVNEVFRRTASGQMVVDLTIQVEDVQGATEYEIRSAT